MRNDPSANRPATSGVLNEAIRKARIEEAERLDVAAGRRDCEMTRLELLRVELESVFEQVPQADDRFDLALVPSRPARLWIDMLTYVTIAEDGDTYCLTHTGGGGRRVLLQTPGVHAMADRVVAHMARQIVAREQAVDALAGGPEGGRAVRATQSSGGLWTAVGAFAIGLATGVLGYLAAIYLANG